MWLAQKRHQLNTPPACTIPGAALRCTALSPTDRCRWLRSGWCRRRASQRPVMVAGQLMEGMAAAQCTELHCTTRHCISQTFQVPLAQKWLLKRVALNNLSLVSCFIAGATGSEVAGAEGTAGGPPRDGGRAAHGGHGGRPAAQQAGDHGCCECGVRWRGRSSAHAGGTQSVFTRVVVDRLQPVVAWADVRAMLAAAAVAFSGSFLKWYCHGGHGGCPRGPAGRRSPTW